MSWIGSIAQGAGTTINAFAGAKQAADQNKKLKNAMSDYPYNPYAGSRPPNIDRPGYEYLRPTQDLTQKTVMDRSQGIGVGYDPQRRQLLTDLVKSQLAQQEEDQYRSAKGAISASGLSGNPRAYEALAGRVKRDTGRQLGDSMAKIAIEDLTRANEERDVNTGRLMDLNSFNFGQENNVADFDLAVWQAEENAKQGRVGLGFDYAQLYRNPYSVAGSTFGNSLVNMGSQMQGGGGGSSNQMSIQPAGYSSGAGQGIAPVRSYGSGAYTDYYQPLNSRSSSYRNLVR